MNLDDVLHSSGATMDCGLTKVRKLEIWSFLSLGSLKFNVDGAARINRAQQVLEEFYYSKKIKNIYIYWRSSSQLQRESFIYVF